MKIVEKLNYPRAKRLDSLKAGDVFVNRGHHYMKIKSEISKNDLRISGLCLVVMLSTGVLDYMPDESEVLPREVELIVIVEG